MGTLFFYGTLRHPPLLRAVLGHDGVRLTPGWLEGYRAVHAGEENFPILSRDPVAKAEGLLAEGLSETDVARLDFYEGGYGYELRSVTVRTAGRDVEARVFLPLPGRWPEGRDWSLADWQARVGDTVTEAAPEYMSHFGERDPHDLVAPYGTMLFRAGARLRARSSEPVATLRRGDVATGVETLSIRRPYLSYFMVEERDLVHPTFDGGMSAPVTRAAFVMGDAVTVLPYDPVRDSVLLVEQFRFGPFVRGDRNPWSLEAIAGRIDPGEDPADTARREALEEANLALGRLERIAGFYPSPGAVTEYIISFVALADLPPEAGGIGGMASEHEDIRSHVVPFARLMDLVASGEVDNGPLVLTAYWLAANRERLRTLP